MLPFFKNRMKIDLVNDQKAIDPDDFPFSLNLQVDWLYGAPARDVDVEVAYRIQPQSTWERWKAFTFLDPARAKSFSWSK